MGLLELLSGVGHTLDTPGAFVRTALSGRNPFPAIFDTDKRVYGRQLLEQYGLLDRNKEGLDGGDVAGFGAELLLDPLMWTGTGLLTKGIQKHRQFGRGVEEFTQGLPRARRAFEAENDAATYYGRQAPDGIHGIIEQANKADDVDALGGFAKTEPNDYHKLLDYERGRHSKYQSFDELARGPKQPVTDDQILGYLRPNDGFYSRLDDAAQQLPAGSHPINALLEQLRQAKGGISEAEATHRGLPQYLEQISGPQPNHYGTKFTPGRTEIDREELLEFLKENPAPRLESHGQDMWRHLTDTSTRTQRGDLSVGTRVNDTLLVPEGEALRLRDPGTVLDDPGRYIGVRKGPPAVVKEGDDYLVSMPEGDPVRVQPVGHAPDNMAITPQGRRAYWVDHPNGIREADQDQLGYLFGQQVDQHARMTDLQEALAIAREAAYLDAAPNSAFRGQGNLLAIKQLLDEAVTGGYKTAAISDINLMPTANEYLRRMGWKQPANRNHIYNNYIDITPEMQKHILTKGQPLLALMAAMGITSPALMGDRS